MRNVRKRVKTFAGGIGKGISLSSAVKESSSVDTAPISSVVYRENAEKGVSAEELNRVKNKLELYRKLHSRDGINLPNPNQYYCFKYCRPHEKHCPHDTFYYNWGTGES